MYVFEGDPGEETVLAALADPIRWATMASLLEGKSSRPVEVSLGTLLIELHHRHLPKLAAHSLVEDDAERRTVLPLGKANELRFVGDE